MFQNLGIKRCQRENGGTSDGSMDLPDTVNESCVAVGPAGVFGETPKTAVETTALPDAIDSFQLNFTYS